MTETETVVLEAAFLVVGPPLPLPEQSFVERSQVLPPLRGRHRGPLLHRGHHQSFRITLTTPSNSVSHPVVAASPSASPRPSSCKSPGGRLIGGHRD